MRNIIFVNSHPIQYFAPLYKYMNFNGLKTKAWYCSDASIKGNRDRQFGVDIKWDIDLLDGYEYRFFKNNSWKPSHFNGFFGLINLGMIKALFKEPKSVIVVHGWHYFTLAMILLLGKLKGHKVCVRCDNPLKHESHKLGWKQQIKFFYLKKILFPRIDYFLYIGKQNKQFYKAYGAKEEQLVSCPYAVDNDRFRSEYNEIYDDKNQIKASLGIPVKDKVILFSGKYIDKKKPLDLLKAYKCIANSNIWLVLIGEGALRTEMENYIQENNLHRVILTGFVNQSKISKYYSIGDVFVMCSYLGENWGLSVNEAMNFNLPLVISDYTGCSSDLVKEGCNGYVFPVGDIDELSLNIENVLQSKLTLNPDSLTLVDDYSFARICDNLKGIVN